MILFNGTSEYVLASYNRKNHWVKIYERPFRKLAALVLMGKIHEAFSRNNPFTKVITEMEAPKAQVFRTPRQPRSRPPRAEEETESEDWDIF